MKEREDDEGIALSSVCPGVSAHGTFYPFVARAHKR